MCRQRRVRFSGDRSIHSSALESIFAITLTIVVLNLVGFPVRAFFLRWHIPPAVSLMALGVAVGPSVGGVLPAAWLERSATLSLAAFVVLLLRAGLGLPPRVLRRVLAPALLFGLLPAAVEALAVTGLSHSFGLFADWNICLLGGFLVAAVSPAVVLPTMLAQKDLGRGKAHLVPDRIIAQTVINAVVAQTGILLLLESLAPGGGGSVARMLWLLPLAVLGGIVFGSAVGWGLRIEWILGTENDGGCSRLRVSVATAIVITAGLVTYFGCAFLSLESVFATLALGVLLRRRLETFEPLLRTQLQQVWLVAEIILFVNVGSRIDVGQLGTGGQVVLLALIVAMALLARLATAAAMALKTNLSTKERRYATMAQVPKATIQAVFGALPLVTFIERGQAHLVGDGHTLLLLAVVAIVSTAPIGAVLLERLGERYLGESESPPVSKEEVPPRDRERDGVV